MPSSKERPGPPGSSRGGGDRIDLERLKASLKDSPVVKFGDYQYFVHPVTDGIPPGDPSLLEEAVEGLVRVVDWKGVDKIITAEAMGFPLAALLSIKTRIPYVFARKRRYGFPAELSIKQVTGYAGADLHFNFINRGERLVFVDDVISTGGTLRAVVKAIRFLGAEVPDAAIVFNKHKAKADLEKELGLRIRTLLDVEVVDGKVQVR